MTTTERFDADRAEYLSLDTLRTRIETHQRYSAATDAIDDEVVGAAGITASDDLLDVGCGTASFMTYLREHGHTGRLVGLDTSPAAVDAARTVADHVDLGCATGIPHPDGTFDVVSARHMLYHVDTPVDAIREAHRVLRPQGRFLAVVNHDASMRPLSLLVQAAVTAEGFPLARLATDGVTTETLPPLVESVFGNHHVHRVDNALVFPEPDPAIRYAVSILTSYGVPADHAQRPAVVDRIIDAVTGQFSGLDGPWRVPKGYSVTIARR